MELDALGNKGFKKWPHIPGNLEGHVYVQGRVHAQKTWEGSKLSPLVDLEGLGKQDVKVKEEL